MRNATVQTDSVFSLPWLRGDRRMRNTSVQTDPVFSLPLPRGNRRMRNNQFKQTQSLVFHCHAVTDACALCNVTVQTDSVSLITWLRACAVNARSYVHLLFNLSPKLHWHYYII